MSWSVGQVARFAGTTVRTLHHYDEIGLVTPGGRSASGYRLYEQADLERLQQVLAYRDLGLPLDEIAALLDEDGDAVGALARQHALLLDRIAHLQRTAERVRRSWKARRMGIALDPEEMFEVFGDADPSEHGEEAEERWGETEAWKESQRRTSSYGKKDWLAMKTEASAIEARLAELLEAGVPATSMDALDAAEQHRQHICTWFYDCPREMHRQLGQMYVQDDRFAAHYDAIAPGLASYVSQAVQANADR